MKKISVLFAIIFFAGLFRLSAQSGSTFDEFAEKLRPYFAKELVSDLQNELPFGSDYKIWGWDVGDYSGDSYHDVAFVVKLKAERKRVVHVYLFVDIDGYLTLVGKFPYEYIELPLEIGVIIKEESCFITRKRKKFDWLIKGYSFRNGCLVWEDEFETKKIGKYTQEKYRNFQNLRASEKFILTVAGSEALSTDYLLIPSYRRGREIYQGYAEGPVADRIEYVHKGAYYWEGPKDGSFFVTSAYDDQYLYMTVETTDDAVVGQDCDSCLSDWISVWMDSQLYDNPEKSFFKDSDQEFYYKKTADSGLFRLDFYPGDFLEVLPSFKIGASAELDGVQRLMLRNIKVVSTPGENGMTIKFRIPFSILGFEGPPVDEYEIRRFSCAVVFHDVDNKFRPEEETEIATSEFRSLDPSTYGSLLLIPDGKWFGNSRNIYLDDIIKQLAEYGF